MSEGCALVRKEESQCGSMEWKQSAFLGEKRTSLGKRRQVDAKGLQEDLGSLGLLKAKPNLKYKRRLKDEGSVHKKTGQNQLRVARRRGRNASERKSGIRE